MKTINKSTTFIILGSIKSILYVYDNWHISLVVTIFTNGSGDRGSIPGQIVIYVLELYYFR